MTVVTSIGKITASKDVLNAIVGLAWDAEENLNAKGRNALAIRASEVACEIYNELDLAGYYDVCKGV